MGIWGYGDMGIWVFGDMGICWYCEGAGTAFDEEKNEKLEKKEKKGKKEKTEKKEHNKEKKEKKDEKDKQRQPSRAEQSRSAFNSLEYSCFEWLKRVDSNDLFAFNPWEYWSLSG